MNEKIRTVIERRREVLDAVEELIERLQLDFSAGALDLAGSKRE